MEFTTHKYPDVDIAYNKFKEDYQDYFDLITTKVDEQNLYLIFLSGYMSCMSRTINDLNTITQ